MKYALLSLLLVASVALADEAATEKATSGSWEITLGGSGVQSEGETWVGYDVSVSTNPLKPLPELWFGLNQGFAWEPVFAGSSDINANWSWHLIGDLYLNTGWSVGVVYSKAEDFTPEWRTGPEATFQYYFGDAFVYAGANYDIELDGGGNGWRYSFGIGLGF